MAFYFPQEDNISTEDTIIANALTTLQQLMQRGSYDEAVKYWWTQKDTVSSYSFWSNLGVLELQKKDYGAARFAFEKARMGTVYSPAIEKNLDNVYTALQMSSVGQGVLKDTFLSVGPWKAGFALVLSLALITVVWWNSVNTGLRKWGAIGAIVLGAVGLFILSDTSAIITIKPVALYQGPSQVFKGDHSLPVGVRLLVSREGDWLKAKTIDGETWWIKGEDAQQAVGWLWGETK